MSGWVAGAVVVGGYLSSEAQKDAAKSASKAQSKAAQAGISEERRQYEELQKLMAPYAAAGIPALQEQQALLGLGFQSPERAELQSKIGRIRGTISQLEAERANLEKSAQASGSGMVGGIKWKAYNKGISLIDQRLAEEAAALTDAESRFSAMPQQDAAAQQAAAVQRITQSPMLQEQIRQQEEALLQGASATGGLRGGNVQAALAQFRPAMINQAIQQRYENLAGMTTLGQQSAAGVGASGMQSGSNIAALMAQRGAAQAGGALAAGQAQQSMINTIPQALGTYYGAGGTFGGSTAPASTQYGTTAGSQQSSMLAAQDAGF